MKKVAWLALIALLLLPFPITARAAEGCNGESRVYADPGQLTIEAVERGLPAANSAVLVRTADTGETLGNLQTDADGRVSARLGDSLIVDGAAVDVIITLPSGRREQCAAFVPGTGPIAPPAAPARPPVEPIPGTVSDEPRIDDVINRLFASPNGPAYRTTHERIGIPIIYLDMPNVIFGVYNGRRIALNLRYSYNLDGLAVVLAHELTHALQDHEGRLVRPLGADPENCFQTEIEATLNDTRVWLSLYPGLRIPTTDILDEDLNSTARLYKDQGRDGVVRMIRRVYDDQCHGRPVRTFNLIRGLTEAA